MQYKKNTAIIFRKLIFSFVVVAAALLLYFLINFIIAGYGEDRGVSKSVDVPSNAYFIPPVDNENLVIFTGIIQKIKQNFTASPTEYELVDSFGSRISYLSSSKIELGLSEGLKVEVLGKQTLKMGMGYAIIEVDSIKLK